MAKAASSSLEVAADPRIELLGVVQYLAGGDARAREPELERRFGPWRSHPAVAAYRRRVESGGGEESYGLIVLFLTDPPELRWKYDRGLVSWDFLARAGGGAELERFLDALRDFAAASDFMKYYAESRGRLLRHLRKGERQAAGVDCMPVLEKYLGAKLRARYRVIWPLHYLPGKLTSFIIPYPYQGPGRPAPGPFEVFTIPSRADQEDRRPFYLWSEPLYIPIERYFAEHEAETSRLPPQARFHLVAALSWRLTLNTFWRASRAAKLRRIRAKAPPATWALFKRLEEYESDRGRYPTLESFFPRLLEALSEPAAAKSC